MGAPVWSRQSGSGANRYRLYNDEDVRLFRYLKSKVDSGLSIGELAETGREQLLKDAQRGESSVIATETPPAEGLVAELARALLENDRAAFERKLNGALAVIPFEEALHRFPVAIANPRGRALARRKARSGSGTFRLESDQAKTLSALNQLRLVEGGSRIVVACPAQEWHEIAAMTAAYLCAVRGCRVHYLGANLPFRIWPNTVARFILPMCCFP
jgi:MerR family transcriptional regulator, light-induced transcriptional regulator